eukprot:350572-Chlamydomonas_euryale.AAC.9
MSALGFRSASNFQHQVNKSGRRWHTSLAHGLCLRRANLRQQHTPCMRESPCKRLPVLLATCCMASSTARSIALHSGGVMLARRSMDDDALCPTGVPWLACACMPITATTEKSDEVLCLSCALGFVRVGWSTQGSLSRLTSMHPNEPVGRQYVSFTEDA